MAKIKQAIKHTGKARKELIVAELVEKVDSSKGLVFVDFEGLSHKQLEALKKELKAFDSTIVVAKNSLLRITLEKSQKYADFKDNEGLNLPTATLIIRGDMVEPLKKLQKLVKELGIPKIKFAILEGNLTDEAGVMKIAALPSRDTLIAQFVGTLNSPIQGLVVTLNGTIQKFVMTLSAVAAAKPAFAEATAGEPTQPSEPAPTPGVELDQPSEEASSQSPVAAEAMPIAEPTAPVDSAELEEEKPTEAPTETTETDEKSEGGEN